MLRYRFSILVALAPLALGCNKPEKTGTSDAGASAAPIVAAVDAAALHRPTPKLISTWGKDVNLQGPKAIVHDVVADKYLLSNTKKAFISRLHPEAVGFELKWIENGKKGVVLHAPKGMALISDTLWVADVDTVRLFDRTTGKPTGEVKIPGAVDLAGMTVNASGDVLVADTGDAVYAIANNKTVTTIAKGDDLKNPSAVLFHDGKVWVVSQSGKDLAPLNAAGKRSFPQQLTKGKLDGIVAIPSGDVFISSWDGNVVLRGRPGSAFNASIDGVRSPANLAYDTQRNRLLVPSYEEDELRSYEIL